MRQAERLAKGERVPSSERAAAKAPPPGKDPDTLSLERMLGDVLGLKVDIQFGGKGGKVTIDYRTLEQLDEIIRRLGAPAPSK